MNPDLMIGRLAAFAPSLRHLLKGLSNADARWRPPQGGWSILEILCHLTDEECEDFRSRLGSMLDEPARPWKPIDPQGAAEERGYNEEDVARSIERFELERARSVSWLNSLVSPDWSSSLEHPKLGKVRAGDLLASWAAHDALHLRQLGKLMYRLAIRDAPGFSPAYAGPAPE